jgi:hypothetical protein
MNRKLSAGDAVRIIRTNPPGHRRTPFYIRGKQGVIERFCGEFPNPEEKGHGFDGLPKRALYRVRFYQRDLWAHYRGGVDDTIDVDVFEHWLIPLSDAPAAKEDNI